VLAYMDVDLSTDLAALGPLVAPLLSGHSDLAIGSRLAKGARVVRGPKREFISRCYNLILKGTLAAKFSDAQCGFKAIRADVARPAKGTFSADSPIRRLRDQRGSEPIPVDAPAVPPTLATQLVRFATIGVSSTLAYLVLFLLLRNVVGAQAANFASLLLTAIANTALNRRLTFGIRGRDGAGRHQFEGLIVFGICLTLTSGSLALLNAVP